MADLLNATATGIHISFGLNQAFNELKPLVLFIVGIVIYGIFIYKFYHFIARKDIITLNLQSKYESGQSWISFIAKKLFYILEYLIVIPLIILFWFLVLALLLLFLSKNQSVQTIMLISMALIGAVRVTAYFNEGLSKELAKLLPFVLLGVFLVDISFFSFSDSINKAEQIFQVLNSVLYYFLFIVILEFILRIISSIFGKENYQQNEK